MTKPKRNFRTTYIVSSHCNTFFVIKPDCLFLYQFVHKHNPQSISQFKNEIICVISTIEPQLC